jgi:hypothetical protein
VESLQKSFGHCFEERSDLVHYIARWKFSDFLKDIKAQAPLMVKFNKAPFGKYDLGPEEYARRVSEIKRAYQQSVTARGAG